LTPCPDWIWVPPSILSSGYWGLFQNPWYCTSTPPVHLHGMVVC